MRNEPKRDEDVARARVERDEAIAERDYLLKFLQDMGEALCQGRELGSRPTADGVEVCELYPSRADAVAVFTRIRDLLAMIYDQEALTALEAALVKFR
jgi:predicted nuclease with RNAse H fold